MGLTSALVLYAVIWFMTFLIVIPFRLETQGDRGEVVEGTHASSPEVHNLKRKALITTLIALALWAVIALGLEPERDHDQEGHEPDDGVEHECGC